MDLKVHILKNKRLGILQVMDKMNKILKHCLLLLLVILLANYCASARYMQLKAAETSKIKKAITIDNSVAEVIVRW